MNILIVDDHTMVLEGLQKHISNLFPEANIRTACDKKGLFKELDHKSFNLLLLDLSLGQEDSRTFIDKVVAENPKLKIIVVSSIEDPAVVQGLLNNSIHGFVGKSSSTDLISAAIYAVLDGKQYIDPNLEEKCSKNDNNDLEFTLTRREKEVLRETLKEKKIKEIASTLYISKKTVENHRSSLFQKFEVTNVSGLVKKAIMMGYLSLKNE